MADPNEILKVVNQTDQTMAGVVGNSQAMLKNSIRKLESDIMAAYQKLTVGDNGNLIGPRVNLKQSQKIHKKLVTLFEEQYGTGARRAVKGYATVDAAIIKEFSAFKIAAEFTSVDIDMLTALKEQAYAEYVQFGNSAQEVIAQAMYDTVAAGGSFSELMKTTTGILMGGKDARGRSLSAYATQWANDGVMNYHQSVTLKKAKDANLVTFLYYGDIITTSRRFCIDRVGKVFSKKQIESWDFRWAGKSGPALTYRGGYNCRHHWHPIKKDWIPDGEIPIQDVYAEQGIAIPRGLSIPVWPTVPKKLSKPVVKTGAKAVYEDPFDRWVPINMNDAGAAEWNRGLLKYGEEFAELEGLGPCGPVADNIVQVLRGMGKDARVMYTGFDDGINSFPHYVAVEVNKAGDVVKIWDPTNPFLPKGKQILKVKAGTKPKQYFQGAASDYGEAEIYKVGDYTHNANDLYDPSQFDWFKSKMLKPAAAKKPLKGMPKPKPKKRPKFVPATDRIEAQKATGVLIREGTEDGYPVSVYGTKEVPNVRFNHKGTRAAHPRDGFKSDEERSKILYGKTSFPTVDNVRVRVLNTFNERLAELQDRSLNLGIPRLRGAQFSTANRAAAMSMGDGVYWINVRVANRLWEGFGAQSKKFKLAKLKEAANRLKEDIKYINDPADIKAYKRWLASKQREIKAVEAGHIKQFKGTDWKPGDAISKRGNVGTEYFQYSNEKFVYEMEHEYGHHIHQTLFVDGNVGAYHRPYLEEWLDRLHDVKADQGMITPTKYAEKTTREWFAENYALWRTGKKAVVNKELKPLLEMLDEVEEGTLSLNQLRAVLDDTFAYEDMI